MHSEVDFWARNFKLEDMKLMHKERLYPPRVSVVVYGNSMVSRKVTFTVEITGLREEAVELSIAKDFRAGKLL